MVKDISKTDLRTFCTWNKKYFTGQKGFERGGNKEFYQFLSVSRGSTGEVRSQSYRALDNRYITEEKFNELLERTDSLSRKTYNLMLHLKNSDIKGLKYM